MFILVPLSMLALRLCRETLEKRMEEQQRIKRQTWEEARVRSRGQLGPRCGWGADGWGSRGDGGGLGSVQNWVACLAP